MLLFKQPRKSLSQNHSLMIPWFTLFLEKRLPESPLYWKAIPHSPSTASADLPPLEHNVKNSSLRKSTEIVTLSKRENSPFSQHPHQVTSAHASGQMSFELNILTWELQIFRTCKQELSDAVVPEEINVLILKWKIQNHTLLLFLNIYIFWRHHVFILHPLEI